LIFPLIFPLRPPSWDFPACHEDWWGHSWPPLAGDESSGEGMANTTGLWLICNGFVTCIMW
jgi:hypothetical protein